MAAASEKMVRKQFLVSQSTARWLERLAAARGTSASEIVRQAIDSYELNADEAAGPTDLMDLVSLRLKEAIESTRLAHRKVENTLRALDQAEG